MIRRIARAIRDLFDRDGRDHGLDAELQFHVDNAAEQLRAEGHSREDAERRARMNTGNLDAVKDECRETRLSHTIETSWLDMRQGVRMLTQNPGFTLAALGTLAVGIGATTAIFSLVYGVLLRPLPYGRGDDLIVLHQQAQARNQRDLRFSVKEIEDYRGAKNTLDAVVEHHSMVFLLLGDNFAERVQTAVVSANFFDSLGVKPALGRTFVESDDTAESDGVLVLSHKYWASRHGADPAIVGRMFAMNNRPHRVIGVLPPIPQYPIESDVYMPTSHCPTRSSQRFQANRNARMMTVFARKKQSATIEQARAELSSIAGQLSQAYPESYRPELGYKIAAESLHEELTSSARPALMVLLGAAGFVLLIACANVANLLLAQLLRRGRELALRAALGASRGRLIRQLLAEGIVLSLAGGLLGVAMAPLSLRVLQRFAERFTPRAAEVALDYPVLAFALTAALITGIVFSLAPALWFHRGLNDAVRQGAGQSASVASNRLRAGLVVAQVAVAFVLLAGAGLMLRSVLAMREVPVGFGTENVLSMRLTFNNRRYPGMADYRKTWDRILLELPQVNGATSVALSSNVPFDPAGVAIGPSNTEFAIEGRPITKGELAPVVSTMNVSTKYFATLRQPILQGRGFNERDDAERPQVAMINQTMSRHRWPGENPIGRRVTFNAGQTWIEIIGVVGDVREYGLERPVGDQLYLPIRQNGFASRLIVRTASDPSLMASAVTRALRAIDGEIAIDQVSTMALLREESMASAQATAMLLAVFAGIAIVISAFGIGAVIALSVSQRRRELGIRLALGARHSSIIGMVMQQGLAMTALGAAIGIAAALALTTYLEKLLFATRANDPWTYGAVALLFLMIAALACVAPAWRISTIDPVSTLRQD